MNRSDGVGVSEVVCRPPSLGYVRRYPTEIYAANWIDNATVVRRTLDSIAHQAGTSCID
ncbi:hypothetical protein LOC67_24830 [Stieleria sp. JC731]|uniref:hypothetical protein n=1 Tax=Stieleria sp. JC731 TaxID=2894195 RepID=UPI001E451E44|nr:hypothetical protein [Stieleria sp. JC731]MCC9603789.1 hypothetical protein [Stieleria sp. JC731]